MPVQQRDLFSDINNIISAGVGVANTVASVGENVFVTLTSDAAGNWHKATSGVVVEFNTLTSKGAQEFHVVTSLADGKFSTVTKGVVSNWGEFTSEIESKKDSLTAAAAAASESAASTTGTETASTDSASGSASGSNSASGSSSTSGSGSASAASNGSSSTTAASSSTRSGSDSSSSTATSSRSSSSSSSTASGNAAPAVYQPGSWKKSAVVGGLIGLSFILSLAWAGSRCQKLHIGLNSKSTNMLIVLLLLYRLVMQGMWRIFFFCSFDTIASFFLCIIAV